MKAAAQGTMLLSLRTEEMEAQAPEEAPADHQEGSQHSLWVDEFAPQRYTELLSDDVRPCACSRVPGLLVARKRGGGIQDPAK